MHGTSDELLEQALASRAPARTEPAGTRLVSTPLLAALRAAGTRHVYGDTADVEELLAEGAEVVVLSKGVLEQLRVCPETLALLKNRSIPAHVLPTEEAVRVYNELAARQRVGGLFHSTC